MHNQSKDLFQLQNELINTKINLIVNQKLDRVSEKLNDLKNQMNKDLWDLGHSINDFEKNLSNRITAVETKLDNMDFNKLNKQNQTPEDDYKFVWVVLCLALLCLYLHFH